MGELIKVIKRIPIKKTLDDEIEIEMNHSFSDKQGHLIHIQTGHGRFELSQEAFVHIIGTILDAEKKLKCLKRMS